MQFSNTTTKNGIVQMARRLVNADDNTYSIEDLTANINAIYDDYVSIILKSDTRWQWDDSNFTTFPIATTNLVANQRSYEFNDTFLKIHQVLVADPSPGGDFNVLEEISGEDYKGNLEAWSMLVDDPTSNLGTPDCFTLIGDSVILQPIPNYSVTGGLKVHFQRYESYFTTTDTTKEPGFPNPFHRGLAVGAAYLFALSKNLPQVDRLFNEDQRIRNDLTEFFTRRNKAERPKITARYQNPR